MIILVLILILISHLASTLNYLSKFKSLCLLNAKDVNVFKHVRKVWNRDENKSEPLACNTKTVNVSDVTAELHILLMILNLFRQELVFYIRSPNNVIFLCLWGKKSFTVSSFFSYKKKCCGCFFFLILASLGFLYHLTDTTDPPERETL